MLFKISHLVTSFFPVLSKTFAIGKEAFRKKKNRTRAELGFLANPDQKALKLHQWEQLTRGKADRQTTAGARCRKPRW